jgi:H+/Cl- antiporter ClcA
MQKLPRPLRWLIISTVVGVLCGSASALFLTLLDLITKFRESQIWLLALLPIGGLLIGLLYHHFGRGHGQNLENGSGLLIDEIHDPKVAVISWRLAPLILLGTLLSHLFGGSAGREGTAVQMGGSIADQLARPLGLNADDRAILLMAGMSAGFGSVFGVPFAGSIFSLEVLSIGNLRWRACLECMLASFVAHYTTLAWGVHHTVYAQPMIPDFFWLLIPALACAGICFGLCARLFSWLSHQISALSMRWISYAPLRPMLGGTLLALCYWALHTTRYAGLGVPVIQETLQKPVLPQDWILKLTLTALTLGSGMKGGEVTPLFFIGATLGNSLGVILPISFSLLAAVGLVAVFAGAANIPLTCAIMACEIFGPKVGAIALFVCLISFLCSGHSGIYRTQRIGRAKFWR